MDRTALVLHMDALGEAVFALPLLHALKSATPAWRVLCVARAAPAAVLTASGLPDEVIIRPRPEGARDFIRLARALRAARPDACFALSTSAATCLLAVLSGARRRVGYANADVPWTLQTVPFEGGGHENYLSLLPLLGIPRTVSSYAGLLSVGEAEQRQADALLASVGADPSLDLVAVVPVSAGKQQVKAYPQESWSAVCHALRDSGRRCLLIGSAADVAAHARIAQLAGVEVASLAGKTAPDVLAGVLRRARCVVGPDTGPIHVAAAVGTRCVVIFGPSDPGRTAPCGPGHVILDRALDCRPCHNRRCQREGACLRSITPEEVVGAVEEILTGAQG